MATHLEDPKSFQRALPAWVADSSSLASSNLASCPNRNPPSISSDQPSEKGSVRSPVRVLVGISFIILCDLPKSQLVETERRTASVTGLWWRFRLPLPSAPWN